MDNSSATEELPLMQQRQLDNPGDALNSLAGEQNEKAPYATRLRVILLLSIVCWLVVAGVIALLID